MGGLGRKVGGAGKGQTDQTELGAAEMGEEPGRAMVEGSVPQD